MSFVNSNKHTVKKANRLCADLLLHNGCQHICLALGAGVGFRSPNQGSRRQVPWGVQCSKTNEPGEGGRSPRESFLFYVKGRALECVHLERVTVLVVSDELSLALENPGEKVQISCQAVPVSAAGLQGDQPLPR